MTIGTDSLATTEPVTISALEFDVLWEHLGMEYPTMPLVLKVPSPGKTDDERAAIVLRAWTGLEQRGLGGPVSMDPTLTRLLLLLSHADREIDGRLWVGGEVRVFAAATGEDAVLATLSNGSLTLRGAEASGLPRFALSMLPAVPAGPGKSITLPTEDFEAAAKEATKQSELAPALQARGVRAEDANTLAEMIGDVVNRGQYGTAARDRWGRRVRVARVISFFDTADGRYLQVRREEDGSPPWTTISPADSRRMLQHLTELHEEG
jgi:hypothetical protein